MNKIANPIKLKQLYFVSFIEGGVVMVTELASARILTPYFGASLYSWASTLSITLLALMTGYYFGGHVTTKPRFSSPDKIIWVFSISGLSVLLMPSLGNFIMQRTIAFSFFSGLIISELFFLFLPIFLMGMISPMIIFQITKKAEESGKSAGNIYAISTCGGILFTLIFGFVIIPYYGITLPVRMLGLYVALIGIFILFKEKISVKKTSATLLAVLTFMISIMAFSQNKPKDFNPQSQMHLLESSEGLLGELKVIDQLTTSPDGKPVSVRKLKTNNIQQNFVFSALPSQSLMYYVNFTRQLVPVLPKKETALLVGLGAGSLYSVLSSQHVNVESVEIDKRIYEMGMKYFGLAPHNNTITDGRYFINVTKKKYDLIVLDVIIGENVPGQLITLENFKRCAEILNTNGTLLIEHGGVSSFADNSFIPSVVKTLEAAGFQVNIFNPLRSEKLGDILFVATKTKFDISNIKISDDVSIKGGPISNYWLPVTTFDYRSANVLTDDVNNSDILLKSHYFSVREGIRKELAKLKATGNS